MNLEELQEQVARANRLRVVGDSSNQVFATREPTSEISVKGLSGMISVEPADLVFEAWAGTTVGQAQEELRRHGLCLPFAVDETLPTVISGDHGTLGGLIAMDLPHALSAQSGGPREWTLGMSVVRSDGTMAKCGSKVVKNVAGYDVHKLFVGSRGTLGVIAKVTMRAFSIKAAPRHEVVLKDATDEVRFIGRILRSDFDKGLGESQRVVAYDRASCTVWASDEPWVGDEGWAIGPDGFRKRAGTSVFEERALDVFDPERKFAPGWKV